MARILVLALSISVVPLAPQAQAVAAIANNTQSNSSVQTLPERITVAFENTPLSEAILAVGRRSGVRVTFDFNTLPSKRVTYRGEQVTPDAALAAILNGTGFYVSRLSSGTIILTRSEQDNSARAQGVITGKVTDAKTGRGIQGANVSVGNDRGVTTGEDGSYRVTGVSAGQHTVTVRLVGYAKQTRSVTVGEGATAALDFKLEPSANVLDQVVVTGTVVQTELKVVPSAISVVTAKQIEERGITRIEQLFRGDIPGLFAVNFGSGNPLDEVTMFSRGATALSTASSGTANGTNPIKTYVDGVELADPKYLSQIDPRSIERIEIITGPQASTIYGSNAINGVMQIFTKRGATARPRLTLNLVSGISQNNFSSALTPMHNYDGRVAGIEGRLSYNVGGSWNYVGPWTPAKQTTRTSGSGGGRMQAQSFVTDISFRSGFTRNRKVSDVGQTFVEARANGWFVPMASNGLQDAPRIATLNGQTVGLTLGYRPFSWWSHDLTIGADGSSNELIDLRPRNLSSSDTLRNFNGATSRRMSQRYAMAVELPFTSLARATATLGADHWRTTGSSMSARTSVMTGSLSEATVTRSRPGKNTGGFLQAQLGLKEMLFLTYGLRAEWNPNYGESEQPNLAPRYGVALTTEAGPVTAKLRSSYGRSTRPPREEQKLSAPSTNTSLITWYGPFDSRLSNSELGPEYQQGGEGGLELYLGARGSVVITRYNQTVDALISLVSAVDSVRTLIPNPPSSGFYNSLDSDGFGYWQQFQYVNVGSIRNQGWELQGTINAGPLNVGGTYSWTKSRVIGITPKYRAKLQGTQYQAGTSFNLLPEHTWAMHVSYARSATTVVLNFNGVGFMYRSFDSFYINTLNTRLISNRARVNLPGNYLSMGRGYIMSDLNASRRFSAKVEGIAQIQNLMNFYRNDERSSNAVIGRQMKGGVRINF